MSTDGDPMCKVMRKVSDCQTQLQLWDKNDFGNVRIALARMRKELIKVEGESTSHARVKFLSEEISKLLNLEERMWSQRSKSEWLKYGDQNTKYFQCRAMERNKKIFILGIENEQGDWIEAEKQIGEMFISYYSKIFSMAKPIELESVLKGVQPRVTEVMNTELLKPFRMKEVQLALNQMKPNTAPGLDGLPP